MFFAYALAGLVIFTFAVPPFQKADEPAHYWRSVSLTNLDFTCDRDAAGEYYFPMKRKYAELPDTMRYWQVWHREEKFDFGLLRTDFSGARYQEEAPVYRWCSLPPPGYVPNALGALAGKPFATPLVGFYLARAFGGLFFLGAIVLALRTVPERYKLIVYLYAGLPTVLHQVTAVSYDAVHLSLFPLLFAMFARFTFEARQVKPWELAAFGGLLIWTANVRLLAYYPILLLFFAVPYARLASPFPRYVRVMAAFLGATVLVTGIVDALYLPRAEDSGPGGDYVVDAAAQVRFVLEHPWSFLAACYNTLDRYGDFMLRGVIGFFGWIVDYGFAWLPYYLFPAIAAVVVYRATMGEHAFMRPWQLALLAGAVSLTALSLFFSLYAVWSPVGGDEVKGLHGRYFLGLLPFGALLLTQTAAALGRERLVRVALVAVVAMLVFNMFRAVDLRY